VLGDYIKRGGELNEGVGEGGGVFRKGGGEIKKRFVGRPAGEKINSPPPPFPQLRQEKEKKEEKGTRQPPERRKALLPSSSRKVGNKHLGGRRCWSE